MQSFILAGRNRAGKESQDQDSDEENKTQEEELDEVQSEEQILKIEEVESELKKNKTPAEAKQYETTAEVKQNEIVVELKKEAKVAREEAPTKFMRKKATLATALIPKKKATKAKKEHQASRSYSAETETLPSPRKKPSLVPGFHLDKKKPDVYQTPYSVFMSGVPKSRAKPSFKPTIGLRKIPSRQPSSTGIPLKRRSIFNTSTMTAYTANTEQSAVVEKVPSEPDINPKLSILLEKSAESTKFKQNTLRTMDKSSESDSKCDKAYFKTEKVEIPLVADENLEMTMTRSMTIRTLGFESPLSRYLITGDQIVQVDSLVPLTEGSFLEYLKKAKSPKMVLTVIRPTYMTHTGDRLENIRRKKSKDSNIECSYFVVQVPKGRNATVKTVILKNWNRKYRIKEFEGKTPMMQFFLPNDKIIDVNGAKVKDKKEVIEAMNEGGTFLVERINNELRGNTNTALVTDRANFVANFHVKPDPDDKESAMMGEDAVAIGAREATRFKYWRENGINAKHFAKGIDQISQRSSKMTFNPNELNTELTPSDVKDCKKLQKVTPRSGIIGFVRSLL